MVRSPVRRPRELTPDEIEDAQDLRSVIVTELAATPVDQESLRHAVWGRGSVPSAMSVRGLVGSSKRLPK